MIGYVKGKILSLGADSALIETASGVGFELQISSGAYDSLAGKTDGGLYTYLHVKEDGVALYGFASTAEKQMFLKLITVSGVGPKMGVAVLSGMSLSALAAAIATSDIKSLSRVKGLGKKTAERIVLELREKVSANVTAQTDGAPVSVSRMDSGDEDAVAALMSLGFTRSVSEQAVANAKAQGAKEIEDIIRLALKGM